MAKRSFLGELGHSIASFLLGAPSLRTGTLVKTVFAADGRHRVCFYRMEEDGACGFREEYFDNKILEMNWLPVSMEPANEYPDLDAAIAAAKEEVPWLRQAL
ncbi:MAG: hypothetical protein Q7R35_00705 [Elusimicrobiota bacterium]|nr:hypothetical protein [Elusimicrobiota bacterium]